MKNSKKLSLFRSPYSDDCHGFTDSKNNRIILVSESQYINSAQKINTGDGRWPVPTTWWTGNPGCGGCCSGTDTRYYRYTHPNTPPADIEVYKEVNWGCNP
jgi:hypothetical protein